MKLICVEEHVLDPAIGQAAQARVRAEAPYLADWGRRVVDGRQVTDPSRPHVIAPAESARKALEMGASRLADMDAAGIDMQVLSYGGFPQLLPAADAIALNCAANDRLAEAVQSHPTRYAGFATLPWQAPDAAARELERAVKELGLKGALINGRPGHTFLDDTRYAPILAALDALKVPLYIHPGLPLPAVQAPYYGGLDSELSARLSMFAWGWHNEAGIQVVRMLLAGVFDRHRNLQVISGHWGEMVPFFLQRLEDSIPQQAAGLERSIVQTYREHVYVSPSGMLTLPHFQFVYALMGAQRILYSIDYPYQSLDGARAFIDNLPISDAEKALIAHGNAARLLRL
ncbi:MULTISPECIES: amidohydrolase family protein [Xanthomonas]|uniref:Amidohydrolase family protein n=1 Tax=Xanthomonas dyei TaxID=743699 RepID=A0ABZ0D893_9XANT|nr:amidohydrolase family protein [Xanthomonas dyei]WOB24513.1 amidohydrolase family protein [Xanthomonas dyei]WOB52141.1 amidohydrolase family protein [Xanthomonas dyei]